ncbi:MAG: hypothetical protein QOF91_2284 [Alphaproteobacteria bacterium]|nr:hypothetical protein [Alphaproteobacteria bacterium]
MLFPGILLAAFIRIMTGYGMFMRICWRSFALVAWAILNAPPLAVNMAARGSNVESQRRFRKRCD